MVWRGFVWEVARFWRSLLNRATLIARSCCVFPFYRFRNAEQNSWMIRSFACTETEALFNSQAVPRFRNIERVARRRLLQLQAATELSSLRVPPDNQLEALKGDRKGQHSIRINGQWRLCFQWHDDGAYQVEIVDYHYTAQHLRHRMMPQPERIRHARAEQRAQVHAEGVGDVSAARYTSRSLSKK